MQTFKFSLLFTVILTFFFTSANAQNNYLSFDIEVDSPTGDLNILNSSPVLIHVTNNLNTTYSGWIHLQYNTPFVFVYEATEPAGIVINDAVDVDEVQLQVSGLNPGQTIIIELKPPTLCGEVGPTPYPADPIEGNFFTFLATDQGGSDVTVYPETQYFPIATTELLLSNFTDHLGQGLPEPANVQNLYMGFNSNFDEGPDGIGYVRSYDIEITGYTRRFSFVHSPELEISMENIRFEWIRSDDPDWPLTITEAYSDHYDPGEEEAVFYFGYFINETALDFGVDALDNPFLPGDIIRVSEQFEVTNCTSVQPGQFSIPTTEYSVNWYCEAYLDDPFDFTTHRAVNVTPASTPIGISMESDVLNTDDHLLHLCDDEATVSYTFSNSVASVPNTGHKEIHSVKIPINLSWFDAEGPGDLQISMEYLGNVITPANVTYNSSGYFLTITIPETDFLAVDDWYGTDSEQMLPEGESFTVKLHDLVFHCNNGNLLGWGFDGVQNFFSDDGYFNSCDKGNQMPFDHNVGLGATQNIEIAYNDMCNVGEPGSSSNTSSGQSLFSNNNESIITSNGATNVYNTSLNPGDPFYDENASTPEITVSFGGNGGNPFFFSNGSIPLFDTAQVTYQVRIMVPEFLAPLNGSDEFEISIDHFDEMINDPDDTPTATTLIVDGTELVDMTGELNDIEFNFVEFLVEVPSYTGALQFNLDFDFDHDVCALDSLKRGGLVKMFFQTEAVRADCEDCVYVTACAQRDILIHCIGPCSSFVGTHENSVVLKRSTLGWTNSDMDTQIDPETPGIRLDRVYPGDLVKLTAEGISSDVDELYFELFYTGTEALFTFLDGGIITYTDANGIDFVEVILDPDYLEYEEVDDEIKITLVLGEIPGTLTLPVQLDLEAFVVADIPPDYNPDGTLVKFIDESIYGQFVGLIDSTLYYSCDPWGDEMTFIKADVHTTALGAHQIGFYESGRRVGNAQVADHFAFYQHDFFVRGICSRQMIFGTGVFGTMIASVDFEDFPNEFRPVVHWKDNPEFMASGDLEIDFVENERLYHPNHLFDTESKVWRGGADWELVTTDGFEYEGIGNEWIPLEQDGSPIHGINPAFNTFDLSIARQVRSVLKYAECPELENINQQIVDDGEVGNYTCESGTNAVVQFDFPYLNSPWTPDPDNQNLNEVNDEVFDYENCEEKVYFNMGVVNPGGTIDISDPQGSMETFGLHFFTPSFPGSAGVHRPTLIERAFLRFDDAVIDVDNIVVTIGNNAPMTLYADEDLVTDSEGNPSWPIGRVPRISTWESVPVSIVINYEWIECHSDIPITFGFTCDGSDCDGCDNILHYLQEGFNPCWEEEIVIQPEILQGVPTFSFEYTGDEETPLIGSDACDTYNYASTISNDGLSSLWNPVFEFSLDENLEFDGSGLADAYLMIDGLVIFLSIDDFEVNCDDGICTYTFDFSDYFGNENDPFELLPGKTYTLSFGLTANCNIDLFEPLTVSSSMQLSNFCGDTLSVMNSGNNIPIIPFSNDKCEDCPEASNYCLEVVNELGPDQGVSLSTSDESSYVISGIMDRDQLLNSGDEYYSLQFDIDGTEADDGYLIDGLGRDDVLRNSLKVGDLLFQIGDSRSNTDSHHSFVACFQEQANGSYALLWRQVYVVSGSFTQSHTSGIVFDDQQNRLLVTGSFENTNRAFILAINPMTGVLIDNNSFRSKPEFRIRLTDSELNSNGDLLLTGLMGHVTNNEGFLVIFKIDSQNLTSSGVFSRFFVGSYIETFRQSTCKISISGERIFLTGNQFRWGIHTYVLEVEPSGNSFIEVSNRVVSAAWDDNVHLFSKNITSTSSDEIYVVGRMNWGASEQGFVLKLNSDQVSGTMDLSWSNNILQEVGNTALNDVLHLNDDNIISLGTIAEDMFVTSFNSEGESCCHIPLETGKRTIAIESGQSIEDKKMSWQVKKGGKVDNHKNVKLICDTVDVTPKSQKPVDDSENGTGIWEEEGFHVYPNPITGAYNVELMNHDDGIESILFQDMFGRVISEQKSLTNDAKTVQTVAPDVVNGVYFIRVKTINGHYYTNRVFISR